MSILLLVVVLLVIAIVLSRLTWASQFGERRSIKHHEQAMDVLRSVAGRPEDAEERAYSAQGAAHGGNHVRSSVEDSASFPAPAPSPVPAVNAGGRAVPEASLHREETIRILRSERTGAEPPSAEPPSAEPPSFEPPRAESVTTEPPGSEAPGAEPTEARPEEQPAHTAEGQPDGNGGSTSPRVASPDDDTSGSGPVTLPPGVADAIRGARGRRANGGGWSGDQLTAGGDGSGNGHGWEDDPALASSTLPKPPSIDWTSSRSEARSRSRARTRSKLWGRVLAPFVATGRAASGARDRLGARRAAADADTLDSGSGTSSAAPVAETTPAEGVHVVSDDTAEVAVPTEHRDADVTTANGDEGNGVSTAPVAQVPPAPSDGDDNVLVPEANGPTAIDAAPRGPSWGGKVSERPRWALAAGLAAVVVVVCVVVGVLVATSSTSSKKAPPASQASPPASTAPAPPPPPLTLVSHDDQGAVWNVNANRLSVSAVATGRVWLEIVASSGPSGPVLWQGVLTSGQSQTITNDAPVWMRIGASSNVTVTVNGKGVLLPQAPNTYNLTFQHAQA
ncbi:MAG: DUF4115 domain-containing protein [Actinobacteria bacterium]|nr:MAG: DUF4115 domain-containing protein [Actinomycetota bacterium]